MALAKVIIVMEVRLYAYGLDCGVSLVQLDFVGIGKGMVIGYLL